MMLALHNLTRKITQAAKTKEIYTTKKREGFFIFQVLNFIT